MPDYPDYCRLYRETNDVQRPSTSVLHSRFYQSQVSINAGSYSDVTVQVPQGNYIYSIESLSVFPLADVLFRVVIIINGTTVYDQVCKRSAFITSRILPCTTFIPSQSCVVRIYNLDSSTRTFYLAAALSRHALV